MFLFRSNKNSGSYGTLLFPLKNVVFVVSIGIFGIYLYNSKFVYCLPVKLTDHGTKTHL